MPFAFLDAVTTYQTWDEYLWKSNLLRLVTLAVTVRVVPLDHWLPYSLGALFRIAVWGAYAYFSHQVITRWNVDFLNKASALPYQGPVTQMVLRFLQLFQVIAKEGVQRPKQPATATVASLKQAPMDAVLGLFAPAKRHEPVTAAPASIGATTGAPTINTAASTFQFFTAQQPNARDEPLTSERDVTSSLKRMLDDSDRLAKESKQATRACLGLSFEPSIPPPRPPAKRMDKSLWQLRTDKMVLDFRDEQIDLFQQNWAKFNDLKSKIFYDRLNTWLSSNIFQPMAKTIKMIDDMLPNVTVAECTHDRFQLVCWQLNQFALPLSAHLVRECICYPGLGESQEAREHMAARIKDLATGSNLTAYQYTARQGHLPSDAKIVWHCFRTWMEHEKPSVVPPLIQEDGDIFRFLLVYFYITDDMKKEIFY
ncbi:hypothetical protein BC940DRAFT_300444 [Gongronella butleri]|nr:hypothetical protein BC940DRAFT_300444 [Gongronella butleri]